MELGDKWSDTEKALLIECFPKKTNKELLLLFPQRTWISIYKKAWRMKLTRNEGVERTNRSQGREWTHQESYISNNGYRLLYRPEHHRADQRGYVLEHIWVWENAHGEQVEAGDCVHHINGDKLDNNPSNLQKMSHRQHTILHHTGAKRSTITKSKLSQIAKERYKCPQDHPRHIKVDILEMQQKIQNGRTVKSVCEEYNINRTTYYKKLKKGDY
jgi:hypothetical protein